MMTIRKNLHFRKGEKYMLEIDHLVIASQNPEEDAQQFADKHGVTVLQGGKHEKWGTYNYLAFFENNSYIEWLGVFDRDLASKSDNPLIQQTISFLEKGNTGLVTYALRTNDMDNYLNLFAEKSIHFHGPFPGSRKTAEGQLLTWRMLFPDGKEPLPFLIEWGSGINLPEDKTNINTKSLSNIELPGSPTIYLEVFRLKSEENQIELENGHLQFTTSSQLDFEIR